MSGGKSSMLRADGVAGLVADWLTSGKRVIAPAVTGAVDAAVAGASGYLAYRPISRPEEIGLKRLLGGDMPRFSAKEFFLPPTEPLLQWRQKKNDVELAEVSAEFESTVLFGVKPCDAAALELLDKVMGWDYRDELWFGRRQAATVVALACPGVDDSCFCTALGMGPDGARGADLLLTPVEGGYLAETLTAKGEALMDSSGKYFTVAESGEAVSQEARGFREKARRRVEKNFHFDQISGWLGGHFSDAFWDRLALRCHGCGACAAVCPTCHCFDIVDEPDGVDSGTRRRNWDTCQSARFTLHGSGHNPRHSQSARCRQRVLHKFSVFPARFHEILCTGCGRCARCCPAGMDLPDNLRQIEKLAAEGKGL